MFPFQLKTVDKYLFQQMLDYFLLGVAVFTLIVFFSDAFLDFIRDIQKLGIPLHISLILIGLQLPQTVAVILPASIFMAVLMVYNGLNNNFELIAMRINGISLNRLVAPALVLGLMASIFSYLLGDFIVPYCNQQAVLLKEEILKQGTLPIGRSSFTFKDYDKERNLKKLIYISQYSGNKLDASTIIDFTEAGIMKIIQSRSGNWFSDRWEFNNTNLYTLKGETALITTHFDKFKTKNLLRPEPKKKDAEANKGKRDQLGERLNLDSGTQNFASLFSRLKERERRGMRISKSTYVNLWEKITMPLSCLVIILTAVPLALTPPRSAKSRGFVFSLAALFLYYILRSVFVNIGSSGAFTFFGLIPLPYSIMIACWLPVLLIGLLGLFLLAKKSKTL